MRKNACKAFLGASGKENRYLQAECFVVIMRNSCLKNFKVIFPNFEILSYVALQKSGEA